jgi:hypothetical protein
VDPTGKERCGINRGCAPDGSIGEKSQQETWWGNLLGLVLTKEDKAEGEVEVFFKQLWWVPHSPSTRVSQPPHNLFWVWSDLWESKTFHVGDLHPVQPRDTLSLDLKVCTFVAKIWGKGERESFVQVLKNSMAGRENKGRGRGCGGRKDFWADQNWWNPNYPRTLDSLHPSFTHCMALSSTPSSTHAHASSGSALY